MCEIEMIKGLLSPLDYDRYIKYKLTDHKEELLGGLTYSEGTMEASLVIKQPKSDRRFKSGKRYVESIRFSCFIRGQGYKGAPPIPLEGYVEVEIK